MTTQRRTQNKINLPILKNTTSQILSAHGHADSGRNSASSANRRNTLLNPLPNNPSEGSHNANISANNDLIQIEDFDETVDPEFIKKYLTPYLKDLYKDLLMRSSNQTAIDKVTFIEYTKLPGIINDRLHVMFSNYR